MDIHIGREIEKVYLQSGMKLSEFARRINTSTRNIYSIFSRNEIKTDQLLKIGEVLKFNFFQLYADDPTTLVAESQPVYAARQKVLVTIELDGNPASLEKHILQLTAINKLLAENC